MFCTNTFTPICLKFETSTHTQLIIFVNAYYLNNVYIIIHTTSIHAPIKNLHCGYLSINGVYVEVMDVVT